MSSVVCPECRQPVPSGAPAGLCPGCLLAQGLNPAALGAENAAFAVTTPQPGRSTAPPAGVIAGLFPQLEIIELIGQGGMGAVYKARQPKLDRLVAVKIIRSEASADPAFAERFTREARTLAKLNHPGIVNIHDFGEIRAPQLASEPGAAAPTIYYFVMEYVDGANLRQLLKSGRLSPELAVSIVPRICEALQYAHENGVVHRDIKPENILLDSRGRVRIADFGLAKLAGTTPEAFTLTGTHQVMGTPQYMAPEQMAGSRGVDHRADIYSLGIVFYEMLTGTVPVGHFSLPSRKCPVDRRLDDVILRALASEPEQRFQTARDLQSSVECISSPSVPVESAAGRPVAAAGTGMSTIIDHEIAGAWRLLAGHSETAAPRSHTVPGVLLQLLAVIGFLCVFFPWFEISLPGVPQTAAVNAVAAAPLRATYVTCSVPQSAQTYSLSVAAASSRMIAGRQLYSGMMTAALLGCLAGFWLCVPGASRLTWWATGTGLIISVFALLAGLLSQTELKNPELLMPEALVSALERSGVAPTPSGIVGPASSVHWEPAFLVLLGCGLMLTILHIAGLRTVLFSMNPDAAISATRSGSVFIRKDDAAADRLPNLCMVCGDTASMRVGRQVQYQPKWAEAATFFGFIAGGIPGLIIGMLTSSEMEICCPLCDKHRSHWSRFGSFAATGWLLPIFIGGLGFLAGFLPNHWMEQQLSAPAIIGLSTGVSLGVFAYVIPLIVLSCREIKCEASSEGRFLFSRVSDRFAEAVRQMSQGSNSGRQGPPVQPPAPQDRAAGVVKSVRDAMVAIPGVLNRLTGAGASRQPPGNGPDSPIVQSDSASPAIPAADPAVPDDRREGDATVTERPLWFSPAVQPLLLLIFIACFMMFISFRLDSSTMYGSPGMAGQKSFGLYFGQPGPWMEFHRNRPGSLGFGWNLSWFAPSVWIMAVGMAAYWAFWQIEIRKSDKKPGWFWSPKSVLAVVVSLALISIGAGWAHWEAAGNDARSLLAETRNGDVPAVLKLLEAGADPNENEFTHGSPLYWAVCNGDPAIVSALLTHGADTNSRYFPGVTPIMVAALKGDVDSISALLDGKADINARDWIMGPFTVYPRKGSINWPGRQMTALMLAASQGHVAAVRALLVAGADPAVRDADGKSAEDHAREKNFSEVEQLIRTGRETRD